MAIRAVLLTAALATAGAAAAAADPVAIAVITPEARNQFWDEVAIGAETAGQRLGIDIWVRGPADEDRGRAQAALVAWAIGRGAKALVIAPNDPDRSRDVADAKARGVPTVYIDRDPGGAAVAAFVGTDNRQAGELAGRQLAALAPAGRKAALLGLKPGIPSTDAREFGFIAAWSAAGRPPPALLHLGTEPGEAIRRASAVLAADQLIGGLFAPNELTTRAALLAIRQHPRSPRPVLVGFDSSAELLDGLATGDIAALIVQDPRQIGAKGVETAAAVLRGERVPDRIDIPVKLVTAADLPKPRRQ